jgi:hypothetical protein
MSRIELKVYNKTTGAISLHEQIEIPDEEARALGQKLQALVQEFPIVEVVEMQSPGYSHLCFTLEIPGTMAIPVAPADPSFEQLYRRSSMELDR